MNFRFCEMIFWGEWKCDGSVLFPDDQTTENIVTRAWKPYLNMQFNMSLGLSLPLTLGIFEVGFLANARSQ